MKFYDQTSEVCESRHISEIYSYLKNWFDDDWGLYIRQHNQMPEEMKTLHGITIVISAEGHSYLPIEIQNPAMRGVFMHYLTKNNPVDLNTCGKEQYRDFWTVVYEENNFVRTPKLFELPLGTTKWFEGNEKIPIDQRKYNVSFIGQLDPYRRSDFFTCLRQFKMDNSFIHFYEGWNRGLGPEKYSEIMSDTKIALVPWGSGSLDTFRFYEAMSCGCVVLCIRQNNYEFMKGSPHIQIPNWNPFIVEKYIQKLLKTDLQPLSDKSRSFWENNLSPKAAAQFIKSKILGE
jgi:hypothetical protein